jgi:hypothetical protein
MLKNKLEGFLSKRFTTAILTILVTIILGPDADIPPEWIAGCSSIVAVAYIVMQGIEEIKKIKK